MAHSPASTPTRERKHGCLDDAGRGPVEAALLHKVFSSESRLCPLPFAGTHYFGKHSRLPER